MEIKVMINAKKSFTKMEKKDGLVMDIGQIKIHFQEKLISICMLISLLMDKKNMLLYRQEIKMEIAIHIVLVKLII